MAVRLTRRGHLRHDTVTEMLKYLRYRYELSERVLYHHTKLAADAMLAKMLGTWAEMLSPAPPGGSGSADVPTRIKNQIERELLSRSDDGVLEYLRDLRPNGARGSRAQATVVRSIASDLLERRLYKRVAVSADRSTAEETFNRFRNVPMRMAIERKAARYAGLQPSQVAVWIPPPGMRLKAADVLVDRNGVVSRLSKITDVAAGARQIYDSHRQLWALAVYASSNVAEDVIVARLLARWFQEYLGVPMIDASGTSPPPLSRLAVEEVAREHDFTLAQVDELAEAFRCGAQLAALGDGSGTHSSLVADIEVEARAKGWITGETFPRIVQRS